MKLALCCNVITVPELRFAAMWGGQSCPQPAFSRLDSLEKRVRGQEWPPHNH